MSSNGKRNRRREYTNGKDCSQQPGDEIDGTWPREDLLRFDAKFCERMQRAIENGLEQVHCTERTPQRS